MSIKVFVSPRRYVQGPSALTQLGANLALFGIRNPLILASPSARAACQEAIAQSLDAAGLAHAFLTFQRECTFAEIERVKQACLAGGHDGLIGCGGGKTLDTARAAAAGAAISVGAQPAGGVTPLGANVPSVMAPTVAASDAPTASVSVIYNDAGVQEAFVLVRVNPVLVLVDTEVIARAPVRTLVAGMGDALATHFETEASVSSGLPVLAGGLPSQTARMMARLAWTTLQESGREAVREARAGAPGPALEAVVEANILLSGLGYECGGLAAAHALAGSWTLLHDRFDSQPYHGELVAFSTLTQLLMEGRGENDFGPVLALCRDVGLPTTFEALGLGDVSDDALALVADATAKSLLIRTMPQASPAPDSQGRFYDPGEILRCIRETDARGRKS